jgi:uncharacterized protein YndB with AHSA1/START domain
MKITVDTLANTDLATAWTAYNTPADITRWNQASPDWHSPRSEVDLREGGRFTTRMEAKDGSAGFDFGGVYTKVVPNETVAYRMDDGREATVRFAEEPEGVRIRVEFDAEGTHPVEMQRDGWQAILDSFGRYVEGKG